ncbi:MAG: thiamine-phosphate kinase, partial [Bryocella sp.]
MTIPEANKLEPMAQKPSTKSSKPTGEQALIEAIRRRSARATAGGKRVRLGIGDDCAAVRVPAGHEMLVTTDFSLEGRHFRRDWHPARSVGHRVLARGLSDLAAMGAEPAAAFLSLALPLSVARDAAWLEGFLDGFLQLAQQFHVPLAGGDTSESPQDSVLADIVLLGSAPAGKALLRSKARAGDMLYCTGALGGAAAELAALAKSPKAFRAATATDPHPHLFPAPRIAVGLALRRRRLATACMDLSDGLSSDLAHLCD